ncbi:MAG TPA: hypothetical protein VMY69_08050 [Phycisphaerae bacterium]|nr:hypothetical protein [Phycisphaerae bacterium]
MFEWEDERERSDAEIEEMHLLDELRAEQQDRDDALDIAHLESRERDEERGLAAAFSRMVAAGPSRGTSGFEAETYPGPDDRGGYWKWLEEQGYACAQ